MVAIWLDKHIAMKRAISIAALFAFFVCFSPADARAAADIGKSPYEMPVAPPAYGQFANLDVDTFTVPAHLGEVQYSFKGGSDKVIVHIQDAHCNSFAQHKISGIIEYLNSEYGISMLNLEGGVGEYDLAVFTSITGGALRREVADYFVETGEINGAEFYAINNPEKVTLWGVEDKDLYLKNLKIYRDSLGYKEEVDKYLRELSYILNNLKRHIYTPELLKMDIEYSTYKAGNKEFREYLEFLIKKAREYVIQIKQYKNLYLLAQTMEQEERIDFKRANTERDMLVNELKRILSKNEMRELVEKTVAFKTKRISRKVFYNFILKKAGEIGLDTSRFPALSAYIVYVATYEAVDRFNVMEELDALEAEIKELLYRNDTQRRLNVLSRNLALTKNIFTIALTKTDYRYYLENKSSFEANNYIEFILRECPKYKIDAQPDRNISKLDDYREKIVKFYEYSFERDRVFLKNLRFTATAGDIESAMLMTGGFHTENLCELFEEGGISYISILPKFTSEEGYESPYFSLLAGETTGLQQMLKSAIAKTAVMQIASKLSKLGEAVWGEKDIDTFDAAVVFLSKLMEEKGIEVVSKIRDIEVDVKEKGVYDVIFELEGEPDYAISSAILAGEPVAEIALAEAILPAVEAPAAEEGEYLFLAVNEGVPGAINNEALNEMLVVGEGLEKNLPFVFYERGDGSIGIIFGKIDVSHSELRKHVPKGAPCMEGVLSPNGANFNPVGIEEAVADRMIKKFGKEVILRKNFVIPDEAKLGVLFIDPITGGVFHHWLDVEKGATHTRIVTDLNEQMIRDIRILMEGKPATGILSTVNMETGESIYTVNSDRSVTINPAYEATLKRLQDEKTLFDYTSDIYNLIYGTVNGEKVVLTQFADSKEFELFSAANPALYKELKRSPDLEGKTIVSRFYTDGKLVEFKDIPMLDDSIVDLNDERKARSKYKASLGNKGANIGEMKTSNKLKRLGIKSPDGFIITTNMYREWVKSGERLTDEMKSKIERAVTNLQRKTGGHLAVSVRSGAAVSMPGMMDTKTDITTLDGIYDAVQAVFESWESERAIAYRKSNNIPDNLGTAITVQQMVYGARDKNSFTGVVFSQNPETGEDEIYGEYLQGAAGEELVSGKRTPLPLSELREAQPVLYAEIAAYAEALENYYGVPQEVEFTVESGTLYLLQTRDADTKAAPVATARMLENMVEKGRMKEEEAFERAHPLIKGLSVSFLMKPDEKMRIAKGLGSSPGAVTGKLAFSREKVKELKAKGEKVIFVAEDTSVDDVSTIRDFADGVITLAGGATSHAAVNTRALGKPSVVGVTELRFVRVDDQEQLGYVTYQKGQPRLRYPEEAVISFDGATGELYLGEQDIQEGGITASEYASLRSFSDILKAVNRLSPKKEVMAERPVLGERTLERFVLDPDGAKGFLEKGLLVKFAMSNERIAFGGTRDMHAELAALPLIRQRKLAVGTVHLYNRTIEFRPIEDLKTKKGEMNLAEINLTVAIGIFIDKLEKDPDIAPFLDGFHFKGPGKSVEKALMGKNLLKDYAFVNRVPAAAAVEEVSGLIGNVPGPDGRPLTGLNMEDTGDFIEVSHPALAGSIRVAKAKDEDGKVITRRPAEVADMLKFLLERPNALTEREKQSIREFIERIDRAGEIVALEDHEMVNGGFGRNERDEDVLYLSKSLMEEGNPLSFMGILHESGESGLIELPSGAEQPEGFRHTYFRGVGEKVRVAYRELVRELGAQRVDAMPLSEFIDALEERLVRSETENKITSNEKTLITMNYAQRGDREHPIEGPVSEMDIEGIQGRLDPAANYEFTTQIKYLKSDLRRGGLNINIVPSYNLETARLQEKYGQETTRDFRDIGINTKVGHYRSAAELKERLEKAANMMRANPEQIPETFILCFLEEEIKTVEEFQNELRDKGEEKLAERFVIARDPYKSMAEAARAQIPETKVLEISAQILNNKRLRDIGASEVILEESTRNLLTFLQGQGFIDFIEGLEKMSAAELAAKMKDLFRGVMSLRVTRVNWKEIDDYENSLEAVATAL